MRVLRALTLLALIVVACTNGSPRAARTPRPSPSSASPTATASPPPTFRFQTYRVPSGAHPHDVAPAPGGIVWYTAQRVGALGRLDERTGRTRHIPLGSGSAPHGVIVGPDGAPWITDGGLNAIVRVDPATERVRVFRLPASARDANLNTAAFDGRGILWFTGQAGIYGSLEPSSGRIRVFDAPGDRGPYGICATPSGDIYFASLAGSYIAKIDTTTGDATVLQPPTRGQGARRVWSDPDGRIFVSEWDAARVGMYDPATGRWREWRMPARGSQPYAVYVDDQGIAWLSDFGANALVRFDPQREAFRTFPWPGRNAEVRQLLGRPGEVWGPGSGTDELYVLRIA
jgi:virginiamycin B lyase